MTFMLRRFISDEQMKAVQPPFFFSWFRPENLLCRMPADRKAIYITFDDGPIPEATPEALEILGKYNARATFFLVGDNIRKHPELLEMIRKEGHATGNHTYHHLNGWKTPPGAYVEDAARCASLLPTTLFRPPYGRFTPAQYWLLRKQYRFVLWSILTYDFDRKITREQCLDIALKYAGKGSVVVFHNHLKTLDKVRYALPRFLDHFAERGYSFEPLPEQRRPLSG